MKRNILTSLAAILFCTLAFNAAAQQQQRPDRRMNVADFEKRKMEYIKKEAGLTDEEAKRYFPISNELTRKKFELHRQHRQKMQNARGGNNISNEEYRKLLENDVEVKVKEAELDKEYAPKFEKVLSPEKLYKAQQAEKKFMQQQVANFREGRDNSRRSNR